VNIQPRLGFSDQCGPPPGLRSAHASKVVLEKCQIGLISASVASQTRRQAPAVRLTRQPRARIRGQAPAAKRAPPSLGLGLPSATFVVHPEPGRYFATSRQDTWS